jgi:hypothetical protein
MPLPLQREQDGCNNNSALSSPSGRQQASSWRSWLRVHPAAELFPISDDDVRALADDIKQHGQREPCCFIRDDKGLPFLADGRSRLDGRELAGLKIDLADRAVFEQLSSAIDVTAFVISKNIRRRHLTAEQRRDLIGKLLKAKPEVSNNVIAKQVKADDKTVASVRRELERRSEIPNVETRTDTRGRAQPAKKAAAKSMAKPRPTATPPNPPVVHHGGGPEDRVVIDFICKRLTKEDIAGLLSLIGDRHVLFCAKIITAVISDSETAPATADDYPALPESLKREAAA